MLNKWDISTIRNGKKKAVVLLPIQSSPEPGSQILNSLCPLHDKYDFLFIDSLSWIKEGFNMKEYSFIALNAIENILVGSDLIVGFAFGGTILQYCLKEISVKNCIMLSSPTWINKSIKESLEMMIYLLSNGFLKEGFNFLGELIGQNTLNKEIDKLSKEDIYRLILGYSALLTADARNYVSSVKINYLHLYGEDSKLANKSNIMVPSEASLISVPNAKMRILQDNPNFSYKYIMNYLDS